MKYCPSCGAKAKKVMEKTEKHLGTTTLYRCTECKARWVVEFDSYEQRETIYRAADEDEETTSS